MADNFKFNLEKKEPNPPGLAIYDGVVKQHDFVVRTF